VSLIVVPGCLSVASRSPAAPADGESGPYCHSRMFGCLFVCPRQRTVVLLRSSSRLLRSSSKVKVGQWVTPNPTRPTILVRIC